MRKVNKILMATISILLCLVLISTSVVSGIFAKYVVTKKGQSIVSLEAFGVTLRVSHRTELPDGVTVNTTKNHANNTVSVEVSNISLAPGESIDDVVIFQVAGTPNVPKVDFKLNVNVDADGTCVLGTNADLPGISDEEAAYTKRYSPIGITAKTADDATSVVVLRPWEVIGMYDYKNTLAQGIKGRLPSSLGFSGDSDTITSRIWNTTLTDNTLKISYLSFGFNCYLNGDPQAPTGKHPKDEAEAHMIQTYLQKEGATITVTYTVTLEQGF